MARRDTLVWLLYLCDIEHFTEFKMATATIFDVEDFSTVHPDNLDGRVIPLFWGG